jgi:hypothetical protein
MRPSSNGTSSLPRLRIVACVLMLAASVVVIPQTAEAQLSFGKDTTQRLRRYEHNILYGVALGFAWAGVDQLTDSPEEWERTWSGYGKRLASGVGGFVIQESVTDLAAAAMHRPLTYRMCSCGSTANKIGWAMKLGVMDPLPNGKLAPAYPRILGAYAGSFAQAAWKPAPSGGRTESALINGTISLLIGSGLNVWYELRPKKGAVTPMSTAGP